jgi:hypothetical protein
MSSECVLGSITSPTAPPLLVSRCMSENQACRCGAILKETTVHTPRVSLLQEKAVSTRDLLLAGLE